MKGHPVLKLIPLFVLMLSSCYVEPPEAPTACAQRCFKGCCTDPGIHGVCLEFNQQANNYCGMYGSVCAPCAENRYCGQTGCMSL